MDQAALSVREHILEPDDVRLLVRRQVGKVGQYEAEVLVGRDLSGHMHTLLRAATLVVVLATSS